MSFFDDAEDESVFQSHDKEELGNCPANLN